MTYLAITLVFCAVASLVSSGTLPDTRSKVCNELCSTFGGDGTLLQHACVCSLPQQAVDQVTLERFKSAQLRAGTYHIPLALELDAPITANPPTSNILAKKNILNRWKRNPQGRNVMNPDLSYMYGPAGMRPIIPNNQAAVYEIEIGGNKDDSVQLVFPQSIGLDVKHQYLYEKPDGSEQPYSDYVHEMDSSEEDSKELWPIKKNFNNNDNFGQKDNNKLMSLNKMMGVDRESSFEDGDESEEELWSSETSNPEVRNFSSDEGNNDGYDELSLDYGTSTSDFTTPSYRIQTIDD